MRSPGEAGTDCIEYQYANPARILKMTRWLILLYALSLPILASAVDASRDVTNVIQSGDWRVIEFSGKQLMMYRISTESKNAEHTYIVFDFVPFKECEPTPAVMIAHQAYDPYLKDGLIPLDYKIPGQKKGVDLAKTEMEKDNPFAFYQFHGLTAKSLLLSHDRGHLAIWIPASGDGRVKRSGNVYFSLDGYSEAYKKASQLCNDNR